MNANDHTLHDQRFLRLVADNQLKIHKLCNAYSWNRDDHEDLYQEILCQLWRALPGVTQESFADTWVYRVALNTCITFVWIALDGTASPWPLRIPERMRPLQRAMMPW